MHVSKMGSSLFFSGGLILRTGELTQKNISQPQRRNKGEVSLCLTSLFGI